MSSLNNIETVIITCPPPKKVVVSPHAYVQNIASQLAFLLYEKNFTFAYIDNTGILGKSQILSKRDGRFQKKKFIIHIKKYELPKNQKLSRVDRIRHDNYIRVISKINAMIGHATQNDIDMKMVVI